MPAAASLSVSLVARIDKFRRGMRGAKKELRRFASDVKRLGSSFASTRNLLIGALGGGALIAGIKNANQSMLGLIDTAQKLGIPASELLALRDAARRTGVPIAQLDTALQRAFRRIAEAAQGTGEARNAIKELGLSAEELQTQTPTERVQALADAFAKVEKPSDRLRLAMKLFDSEGVNLVRTLDEISGKGLGRLISRNQELGRTIDKDQIAALKRLRIAWELVTAQIGGAMMRLTTALAPLIDETFSGMSNWIGRNRDQIDDFIGALRDLPGVADQIWAAFDRVQGALEEVVDWGRTLAALGRRIAHGWSMLWDVIKGISDLLGQSAGMLGAMRSNIMAHGRELFRPGSTPESARRALFAPIPEVRGDDLGTMLENAANVPAPFRSPRRRDAMRERGEVVRFTRGSDGVDLSPLIDLLGMIERNTAMREPARAG